MTTSDDSRPAPGEAAQRRSAARLLAVQAIYQSAFTDMPLDACIKSFLAGEIGGQALTDDEDGIDEFEQRIDLQKPDPDLFSKIVRGAAARTDDIDPMISESLSDDWSADRLELTVRAILRAGIWELLENPKVPARVVISEYIDIAHAFYQGSEPKMVNAVLDRLAKIIRTGEFGAS